MRLALDHHYSPRIAQELRANGFDAVAIIEMDWQAEEDEALLALCADTGRSLVTNNVADFAVIARQWQAQGRDHAGLVFTSDASLPRTRDTIGRYVDTLTTLMRAHPGDGDLTGLIEWL